MKASKDFKFEAAHRLTSSYSKACQNIHGHSYRVTVGIEPTCNQLNNDGMVIDFGELKNLIQPLFDLLDHSLILHKEDQEIINFFAFRETKVIELEKWRQTFVNDYQVILMKENPTAENMCLAFWKHIDKQMMSTHPEFQYWNLEVKVYETATSEAQHCCPIGV
jgi:queuosine biosynthesis protein QueD